MTRFVVYWTEWGSLGCREEFTDLKETLGFMEELRRPRKEPDAIPISHVALSIEDDNMVGEFGVEAPPPDYDWKKRRK